MEGYVQFLRDPEISKFIIEGGHPIALVYIVTLWEKILSQ